MFRTYGLILRRLFQFVDGVLIIAAFILAWDVKFYSGWLHYAGHPSIIPYLPVAFLTGPVFVAINSGLGGYHSMRTEGLLREVRALFVAMFLTVLIFLSLLYMLKLSELSRDVIVLYTGIGLFLLGVERLEVRLVLRRLRRNQRNMRSILVVGWNKAMESFVKNLHSYPWFGYQIVGVVSEHDVSDHGSLTLLGTFDKLPNVLREHRVDHVVIALPRSSDDALNWSVQQCDKMGVQSYIVPDYFDVLPVRPRFEYFGDMPLIDTQYVPLDEAANAALKRLFDVFFSLLVLVGASFIYVLVALLVKLSSPGPILYKQQRVGRNRRIFTIYKFRTMRVHADAVGEGWTVQNDDRRTRIGAFLRRTSLDELPQFWNVLMGDMSVIGPRPEQPKFVHQFSEEVPRYMLKHRVRPGITGWAQVNGWRGDTSISERISCDIEYIERWSFGMDMRIVWLTVVNGLVNRNAY